ncbi:MAG TPA: nuclear transport factor 2 family protein [Terriglobales bacterium]|nr:nuclear transport factor 2 family protein [Terriglobales bacterium]
MTLRRLAVLLICCSSAAFAADAPLTALDVQHIRQLHQKYRDAWLAGDADGVRSVFVADQVLLPHHGDAPRVGRKHVDNFWFPAGAPPTKVTSMEVTCEEVGGSGSTAYVWGHDNVSWELTREGKTVTVTNKGAYLNVVRKQPNGEWKIFHHMRDDPAPQQRWKKQPL